MIGKYCMSCGKPNDFGACSCVKCGQSFAALVKPVREEKAPKSAVVSPKSEVILKMNKPQWPDGTPTQVVKKKTQNHNKSGVLPIGDSFKDQGEIQASNQYVDDFNDDESNDIDEVPDINQLDIDIVSTNELNAAAGFGGCVQISQAQLQENIKPQRKNKKK